MMEEAQPVAKPTEPPPIDCDEAKRAHRWIWVWDRKADGSTVWTDDTVCTTCGKIRSNIRSVEGDSTNS